jgi:hypothetical protein
MTSRHYYAFTTNSRQISIFLCTMQEIKRRRINTRLLGAQEKGEKMSKNYVQWRSCAGDWRAAPRDG